MSLPSLLLLLMVVVLLVVCQGYGRAMIISVCSGVCVPEAKRVGHVRHVRRNAVRRHQHEPVRIHREDGGRGHAHLYRTFARIRVRPRVCWGRISRYGPMRTSAANSGTKMLRRVVRTTLTEDWS